jgi:hypothetical protein
MLIAMYMFGTNVIYAALTQDHVNQLKEILNDATDNLQKNSTKIVSNDLETINMNLTKSVCNMPMGCKQPGNIHTDEADRARTPLKNALIALQAGNITNAQNQLTKAYLSLNSLVYKNNPWPILLISFLTIIAITIFVSQIIKVGREYVYKKIKSDSDISSNYYDEENCENLFQEKQVSTKNKAPDSFSELHRGFWDIIREGDYYPSLARFQFLLWTFVISFTLLSFYLIRCSEGQCDNMQIVSTNILELLGISGAVAITANIGSRLKYDSSLINKVPETVPPFSTMLLEGSKPVLYRYQSFLWTFIGIGIYLFVSLSFIFAGSLSNHVPDIDPTVVAITGISNAAYIGAKFASRTPLKITKIVPSNLDSRTITIFGDNFGQKDSITNTDTTSKGIIAINQVPIKNADSQQWKDNKIDFNLPNDLKFEPGSLITIITAEGLEVSKKYCGKITILITSPSTPEPMHNP